MLKFMISLITAVDLSKQEPGAVYRSSGGERGENCKTTERRDIYFVFDGNVFFWHGFFAPA
jgi:hypothetical protein